MEQIALFETFTTPFKIDKPIRLIELFAGIGAQAKALECLGANFEHYRCVEWDKYPMQAYNAIHGTNFTTSDISKLSGADLGIVDTDKYCYIMTYSFPCQDLSVAGKMAGMKKGDGTRSGLLWQVERLLNEVEELPSVLLMENVPEVHGAKNFEDFMQWQLFLESKGYRNYWQDLNAKDYGVAQNRNRCFMVSLLGDYSYKFPAPVPLNKRLKDYLEEDVEQKYYLNSPKATQLIQQLADNGKLAEAVGGGIDLCMKKTRKIEIANCIKARVDAGISNLQSDGTGVVVLGRMDNSLDGTLESANRIYDTNGISPTVNTCSGGGHEPKVIVCAMRGRYMEGKIEQHLELNGSENANSITTVQKDSMVVIALDEQNKAVRKETFGALTTDGSSPKHNNRVVLSDNQCIRIRKLTPKECWRLMGFTDTDFDKAAEQLSNSRLYKCAGNSIVVDVLKAIFEVML